MERSVIRERRAKFRSARPGLRLSLSSGRPEAGPGGSIWATKSAIKSGREMIGGSTMRSWLNRAGVAGVLGLLVISFAVPAPAAEITVLAGMGVISGVSDLAPAYQKLPRPSVFARFQQAAPLNQ